MEKNKFIYLTDKVKIVNPCFDSDVGSFFGEVDNYNFKKHTITFKKLSKILAQYNIFFSTIWEGKFTNINNNIYTRFLVKSNCGRIFWRKYCTKNPGSGQNYIYIDGKKYQTMRLLENKNWNKYLN